LASDAVIGEGAHSFLARLTSENRALWENLLYDQFLPQPVTADTIDYSESGFPDAKVTVVFPFLVAFRFLNAETVAIADITWAPGSPGADPRLASRL
jgi:hypothetical protein